MGTTTEYVDRAIQTENAPVVAPCAGRAVPLVATGVPMHSGHQTQNSSTSTSEGYTPLPPSCLFRTGWEHAQPLPCGNPTGSVHVPTIPRQPVKQRPALEFRHPAGDLTGRRVVSMPENEGRITMSYKTAAGVRVVSMPEYIKSRLQSPVELCEPASTEYHCRKGRKEGVRGYQTRPGDFQMLSPASSPEPLPIDYGTQFVNSFLREKPSRRLLPEEADDWAIWTSSPPRPIPALHGPPSLPYARCPSGAEGTIIEEPDNISRVIWGLSPDDRRSNNSMPGGSYTTSSYADQQTTCIPSHVHQDRHENTIVLPQLPFCQSRTSLPTIESLQSNPIQVQRQLPPLMENHFVSTKQVPISGAYKKVDSRNVDRGWIDGEDQTDDRLSLDLQVDLLCQDLKYSNADSVQHILYQGHSRRMVPPGTATGSSSCKFVGNQHYDPIGTVINTSGASASQQHQQRLYQEALLSQNVQQQSLLPSLDSSSSLLSSHSSPYQGSLSSDVTTPDNNYLHASGFTPDSSLHRHQLVQDPYDVINTRKLKCLKPHPAYFGESFEDRDQMQTNTRQEPPLGTLANYLLRLQGLSPHAQSPLQCSHSIAPTPVSVPLQHGVSGGGSHPSTQRGIARLAPPTSQPQQTRAYCLPYADSRLDPIIHVLQRRLPSVPEGRRDCGAAEAPLSRMHNAQDRLSGASYRTASATRCGFGSVDVPLADKRRTPSPEVDYTTRTSLFRQAHSPAKVRLPTVQEPERKAFRYASGDYSLTRLESGGKHPKKYKGQFQACGLVG